MTKGVSFLSFFFCFVFSKVDGADEFTTTSLSAPKLSSEVLLRVGDPIFGISDIIEVISEIKTVPAQVTEPIGSIQPGEAPVSTNSNESAGGLPLDDDLPILEAESTSFVGVRENSSLIISQITPIAVSKIKKDELENKLHSIANISEARDLKKTGNQNPNIIDNKIIDVSDSNSVSSESQNDKQEDSAVFVVPSTTTTTTTTSAVPSKIYFVKSRTSKLGHDSHSHSDSSSDSHGGSMDEVNESSSSREHWIESIEEGFNDNKISGVRFSNGPDSDSLGDLSEDDYADIMNGLQQMRSEIDELWNKGNGFNRVQVTGFEDLEIQNRKLLIKEPYNLLIRERARAVVKLRDRALGLRTMVEEDPKSDVGNSYFDLSWIL